MIVYTYMRSQNQPKYSFDHRAGNNFLRRNHKEKDMTHVNVKYLHGEKNPTKLGTKKLEKVATKKMVPLSSAAQGGLAAWTQKADSPCTDYHRPRS